MKIYKIIILSAIFVVISLTLASCVSAPQKDVPYSPTLVSPANNATLNSTSVTLSWTCSDPQNRPLNYTIYFDQEDSTPTTVLASGVVVDYYNTIVKYNTTYAWMIVAYNSVGGIATSTVSTFNAGIPIPVTPYNPSPYNGQTNVSTSAQLTWQCYSPDGSLLNYTVYLGTSPNPSQSTETTYNHYNPGTLSASTTYYWKISAQNLSGGVSNGPVWHFTTTQGPKLPPAPPSNPKPANSATEIQPSSVTLSWQDSDPQAYPLVYRIYLGYQNDMTLQATVSTSTYTVKNLNYGKVYNWQIVAIDPYGNMASGDVWTFTTYDLPPNAPQLFAPANFSTNISANNLQFSWTCSDPDGNTLMYNAYLGTSTANLKLYKSGITGNSFTANLNWNTTYYWQIAAIDPFGKTSTSTIWNFTTANPPIQPPTSPDNPSPADGAVSVPLTPTLSWTCSDPQNYPLTYDLYFGTTQTPSLLESSLTSTSYTITTSLNYSTTYYWYVIAKDNKGNSTTGPVWSFTTISQPPVAASAPYPTNAQTGVSPNTQLTWQGASGLTYNLYMGTAANSMSEVGQNLTSPIYTPSSAFANNTTYYWKVISTNTGGGSNTSPVWSFTTGTNSSQGSIALDDQIISANQPFTLNVRGIGISNFQGMEIKLAFNPAKVAINTSQGNNGVSLTGPIANANLMTPTVTSTMIDISLAILGSGNAVNIPNNVCLQVYFTNKMSSGDMTTIKTIYLDVRNGSNQTMDITYSDVGVIRVQ